MNSYLIGNKIVCTVPVNHTDCIGEGYTICKELKIQSCSDCGDLVINNGLLLCDCRDSWNCHLCANDRPYWNPVERGDLIYFQFQQFDTVNGDDPNVPGSQGWNTPAANFTIHSCCDDSELNVNQAVVAQSYVGLYETQDYKGNSTFTNIQQISFNVDQIISQGFGNFSEDHCFYFKFNIGEDSFCSEPYKLNSCRKKTVMIEGEYPASSLDCFGYFYGRPTWSVGEPFTYVNQYRVRGSFELTNVEIEKETVTKHLKAVSASTCEVWLLRTIGLPERVAKLLVGMFAAYEIYIDGAIYQIEKGVDKNNEIGSQWLLEVSFKRCDCFPDFTCV